ncbi:hypothetical protein LXA43DRAFT_1066886 [Ganoderma leucocontextum]|nr:hypothetical protein LXA43DRAFT_1066886 [Ganoderma leucocontextum]
MAQPYVLTPALVAVKRAFFLEQIHSALRRRVDEDLDSFRLLLGLIASPFPVQPEDFARVTQNMALHGWLRGSAFANASWWNDLIGVISHAPEGHPLHAGLQEALVRIQTALLERELHEQAHAAALAYSTDLALHEALARLGWTNPLDIQRILALAQHSEAAWVQAAQAFASFVHGRSVAYAPGNTGGWQDAEGPWDASSWGYDPAVNFSRLHVSGR